MSNLRLATEKSIVMRRKRNYDLRVVCLIQLQCRIGVTNKALTKIWHTDKYFISI